MSPKFKLKMIGKDDVVRWMPCYSQKELDMFMSRAAAAGMTCKVLNLQVQR